MESYEKLKAQKDAILAKQAGALHAYFEDHWKNIPGREYPIIDHALRVEKLPNGNFHFYIHPANTGGTTTDFIVSPSEIKVRE